MARLGQGKALATGTSLPAPPAEEGLKPNFPRGEEAVQQIGKYLTLLISIEGRARTGRGWGEQGVNQDTEMVQILSDGPWPGLCQFPSVTLGK